MIEVKKIGVIGSGTMGNGIAHVSALHGFQTVLLDLNEDILNIAYDKIKNNLNKQLEKGKIQNAKIVETLKRISMTTDYDDLHDCDIIIEAASEDKFIKEKIFKSMDVFSRKDTILASNTSSISITELAKVTNKPHKVIGMHFMNPVPIMRLVEVIKGEETDKHALDIVKDLSIKMNKKPIECNDSPGFISNRILMPMINEAIYCLMEGVGTEEAIDGIMHLGMAHPLGPLALADLIGLDVCHDILEVLLTDLKNDKYAPCPLLTKMVKNGELGKKTDKGFYKYN